MAGKPTRPINYDQIPGCTYCSPEIGSIGLTEAKARERGYDVVVGKFPFSAIGKARILNQASGFVKIVAEKKYDEVLGVHIIGPAATELIAEAGAAMKLEATSEELVRTIHAHPTLSEAIHEAAEAVAGPRDPYLAARVESPRRDSSPADGRGVAPRDVRERAQASGGPHPGEPDAGAPQAQIPKRSSRDVIAAGSAVRGAGFVGGAPGDGLRGVGRRVRVRRADLVVVGASSRTPGSGPE